MLIIFTLHHSQVNNVSVCVEEGNRNGKRDGKETVKASREQCQSSAFHLQYILQPHKVHTINCNVQTIRTYYSATSCLKLQL